MCGIIGYTGRRPCQPLLLAGLERLEYRGYDSAGLSLVVDETLEVLKAVGNLDRLRAALEGSESDATTGIGHTRWATHGRPSEPNAHPFTSCDGAFSVVLNGIVENYVALREQLAAEGHAFASETDAEVVAHLVERHFDGSLPEAVQRTVAELEGHYAFCVVSPRVPDTIVAARVQCPLVVGRGDGENFVASDLVAFLAQTREVTPVEDGEVVVVTPDGVEIQRFDRAPVERAPQHVSWDEEDAERDGHETFMLKEIREQAQALRRTLGDPARPELGLDDETLRCVRRVVVTGCGTALHAGMVGRYLIEELAGLPVACEVASELRYQRGALGPDTLVVAVSQSGETADTIAAQRVASAAGARTLAVCNVLGTQLCREAEGTFLTRAGREIGVAATKTFTAQVAAFTVLALRLAELRGTLPAERIAALRDELRMLPERAERLLAPDSPLWERTYGISQTLRDEGFFFFLGRHLGLPVALEGALKLKEITYIPTDAYPAGEMKHGPIALIADGTPVVAVMTDSHVFDKVVSNVQEVRARGARVIAVTDETRAADAARHADWVLAIPACSPELAPALAVLPLQLLAYRIATARGLSVDRPRNLAKTVTVE